MSLELDARQRAILQEMGITVWQAPQAPVPTPQRAGVSPRQAAAATPAAAQAADVATLERPPATAPQQQAAQPPTRPQPQPTAARAQPPAAPVLAPVAAPVAVGATAAAGSELLLRAPVALYASADANSTPAELGTGWLVILESATPDEPLSGDVGKLLDNMLRAMQLQRHPRTFAGLLERPGTHPNPDAQAVDIGLQQALNELKPAMVLLLGLGAARAVLGSREPLGRLRAGVHQLADGTPAVVSYDPAYLLRAPDAKAAAWADLCRALAIVRGGAAQAQ